jgi:murein DD-endopeptidase MepM/ murein hydrolase activator NlpD
MDVTSPFGWRIHPIDKTKQFHNGIDLKASLGTPTISIKPGKILISKFHKNLGYYLVIDHDGFLSVYCHLQKLGLPAGTVVKEGDIVGYVGSSGKSNGAHLHFEIRVGEYVSDKYFWDTSKGQYPNSVDPMGFINPDYRKQVKDTLDLADETMEYLDKYRFADALYKKISEHIKS